MAAKKWKIIFPGFISFRPPYPRRIGERVDTISKSKFWNSELVNRLWSRPARGRTCPVRPDDTRRERFEINWTDWTTLWRHLTCRNHLRNPPKPNTTRHKSIEKYWNLENSQFTKLYYERFLPPVTKWSLPPKTCCPIRYKNRHPMVRSDVICEKNMSVWFRFIGV